jgi:hypothetical protein
MTGGGTRLGVTPMIQFNRNVEHDLEKMDGQSGSVLCSQTCHLVIGLPEPLLPQALTELEYKTTVLG